MGEVVLTGFPGLGAVCTPLNPASVYGIDRGAIAAGDTSRRSRARLYPEAASRGDSARNWRYVYGLRLPQRVTATGEPVAGCLTPGAAADGRSRHRFPWARPTGSPGDADRVLTPDAGEALLSAAGISLPPSRTQNAHRPGPPWGAGRHACGRKRVDTTGSLIERVLPQSLPAVTAQGFALKVMRVVRAVSASRIV